MHTAQNKHTNWSAWGSTPLATPVCSFVSSTHFMLPKNLNRLISRIILGILLLFSTGLLDAKGQDTGYCDSNQWIVDLSNHTNTEAWSPPAPITPDGPCCGMPENYSCIELIVYLPDEATAFHIEFTTATGSFYYLFECEESLPVPGNRNITFCIDEPQDYYSVTFCRPGNPSYDFIISWLEAGLEDVVTFDIGLGASPSLCINDDPVALTGGLPAGGTYHINGSTESYTHFDPAEHGEGEHTLRYWHYDENSGCYGFAEETINVNPLPELTCQNLTICHNEETIDLAAEFDQLPAGGTFSINGTTVTYFSAQDFVPGDYTFTYSYTDPVTQCSNTCDFTITIDPLPEVEDVFETLCDYGAGVSVDLNTYTGQISAEPQHTFGFFLDEDRLSPVLNPLETTITDDQIIWVLVTDTDTGCETIAQIIFEVTLFEPNDYTATLCDQSADDALEIYNINLNSYNTEIMDAPGLTFTWFEDQQIPVSGIVPIIGDEAVFYAQVSNGICTEVATLTFEIISLPEIICDDFEVCIDSGPIDLYELTNHETDGTFSGAGVFNGHWFDPVTAGSFTFSFSYTDNTTTCTNTCTFSITVNPLPLANSPNIYLCGTAGGTVNNIDLTFYQTALNNQPGHTYTFYEGPGESNPVADPANITVEDGDQFYVLINNTITGCENNATITFHISPIYLDNTDLQYCTEATDGSQKIFDVELTDLNYTIFPGSTDLVYEWFEDAAGLTTVNPTFIDEINEGQVYYLRVKDGVCETDIISVTFNIHLLPVISFTDDVIEVCNNQAPINLFDNIDSPADPTGGTLSGTGVAGHFFDPEGLNPGDYDVIFFYTDTTTGCPNQATFTINVHPLPQTANLALTFCDNGEDLYIDLTGYEDQLSSEDNLTFSWFSDAGMLDEDKIDTPESTQVTDGSVIYASIENQWGCVDYATITIETLPFILTSLTDEFCDASDDDSQKIYNIDLSAYNQAAFPDPSATFNWFADEERNQPIPGSLADTVANGAIFYVEVTDDFCTEVATLTFTIHPLPELSISGDINQTICKDDTALPLEGMVLPSGGSYSGTGVTHNILDPALAGPGVHEISYEYTDGNTCTQTILFEITVKPLVNAICPDIEISVCMEDNPFELNEGTPIGGMYVGIGITEDNGIYHFDPALAGPGTHTITYIYNEDGCEDECTFIITVNELPIVSCPTPFDFCFNTGLTPLPWGAPSGGTMISDHVEFFNGSWHFNTSADPGSYSVIYTYTDPITGCSNECDFEVTIHPPPVLAWENTLAFCPNTGEVPLSGAMPAGGIYSGSLAGNNNLFNTELASPGNHTVTYTYTDDFGCTSSIENTVLIHEPPVADAGSPTLSGHCLQISLSGSASSGLPPYQWQWSPAAMVNDPTIPNPTTVPMGGTTPFTLTVTDQNGCSDSHDILVVVEGSANTSLSPFDPVCLSQNLAELTGGSPLGGSYYINAQSNASSVFIPSHHGAGDHTITYIYTDLNGCSSTAQQTLTVHPLPEIQWFGQEFCEYGGVEPLTGAHPPGGTFFGGNVTPDGMFNIGASGAGYFSVNYTYTDNNGCAATANAEVTVHELPVADAGPDVTIPTGTTATLTANNDEEWEDYSWHWTPEVFVFSPFQQSTSTRNLLFSQIFHLTVTDENTGCQAQDFMIVNISGGGVEIAAINYPSPICLGDTAIIEVLAGGGTPPYQYLWYDAPPWEGPANLLNTGETDNSVFTIVPTESVSYFIEVHDADGNPPASGTAHIIVHDLPTVTLDPVLPVCANNPIFQFPQQDGSYFLTNTYGHIINIPYNPYPIFNPADIGEGNYTLVYTQTNEFGCSASDDTDFIIQPYVNAEFFIRVHDRCRNNEITVRNYSVGSDEFIWDFEGDPMLPDGWLPTDEEFTLTYPIGENPEDYSIHLMVRLTDSECEDEMTRNITIYPRPQVLFSGLTDGCAPHTVELMDESIGEVLFHFWRFGDGALSMEQHPEKVFHNYTPNDTLFEVTLTIATQDYYCTETITQPVTIYPQTVPGFAIDPVEHCNPYEAIITNDAVHADWITWEMGDGHVFTTDEPDTLTSFVHTFENLTSDPITFTITQTVGLYRGSANDSLCCTRSISKEIEVLPAVRSEISANISPSPGETFIEGCSPFTVNFSGENSLNINRYEWNFDDGGSSSLEEVSHTFINQTPETIIREVILWVESPYGCRHADTLEVRIHPGIEAGFVHLPAADCSPAIVDFSNTSASASAMSYTWYTHDEEASTDQHPQITFAHTLDESIAQHFPVTLVAENLQGCRDTVSVTITAYPQPEARIATIPQHENQVLEGCAPFTVTLDGSTSAHANRWLWDMGYGDVSSAQASFEHTFTQPGTYTIELDVSNDYSCQDQTSIAIIVHPTPDPLFFTPVTQGCSPLEMTLDYNTPPQENIAYTWNFDWEGEGEDQEMDHDQLPVAYTLSNPGTSPREYTLKLNVETGNQCQAAFSKTITVFPEVRATITTTLPIEDDVVSDCGPVFPVQLSANTTENAQHYHWDFGDGISSSLVQTSHSFLNFDHHNSISNQVVLTAWSTYGCIDQQTLTVETHPRPMAVFTTDAHTICSPETITFTNNTVGNGTYTWNFGDGSDASDDQHTSHLYRVLHDEQATTFTASLTVMNTHGCDDVFEKPIHVYPDLEADFSLSVLQDCDPLEVAFTNSTRGDHSLLTYTWEYGDGNTSASALTEHNHTFRNSSHDTDQSFTVRLTASYADVCSSSKEETVTVLARPRARFEVLNNAGCSPHSIELANLSEGAIAHFWHFGNHEDTLFMEHPDPVMYHQPADQGAGIFTIHMRAEGLNGCNHTFEQPVTIFPDIEALFTTDVSQGCHPLKVEILNQSSGGDFFAWEYGDGNTSDITLETHPHIFLNMSHTEAAEYLIHLQTTSVYGCTDSFSLPVTIDPVPNASFSMDTPGGCSPLEVNFTNHSTGGTLFGWILEEEADTLFVEHPEMHTYYVNYDGPAQTFHPRLKVTNHQGCSNSFGQQIEVFPDIRAAFEAHITEGCHPLTVNFTNTSEGEKSLMYYHWDYGDGNTSAKSEDTHSHTFHNFSHTRDTTYTVRLTAHYAGLCFDEYEMEITVLAKPLARFSAPDNPGCAPHTIAFENHSIGATQYIWDLGDGEELITAITPDPHEYYQPPDAGKGVFEVSLTVMADNLCTDSTAEKVTIFPAITSDFAISNMEGCHPLTTTFHNQAQGAAEHFWNYGNGHGAIHSGEFHDHTFVNYSHTESASFEITHRVVSEFGCEAISSRSVTVNPVPMASFVSDISGGCSPLEVSFTNATIGGDSFMWIPEVGGDTLITNTLQTHTYHVNSDTPASVFTPTLHAHNSFGCSNTMSSQIQVYPNLMAGFEVSSLEGCSPLTVNLSNTTAGDYDHLYFAWDYGDGNTSSLATIDHSHVFHNHSHKNDTTFTIKLHAWYADVCFDEAEVDVTILARPLANFTVPNSPGCSPHAIEFVNQSVGASQYLWDMGDGSDTVIVPNPADHLYQQPAGQGPGLFHATLLVTAENGCTHQTKQQITIYPDIEAQFELTNHDGCHPLDVEFINLSSGTHTMLWDLGDGNLSTSNPTGNTYYNYDIHNSQSYQVTLTTVSQWGCSDEHAEQVWVRPVPKSAFALSENTGCAPFAPAISNLSLGAETFLWNFGDGDTLTQSSSEEIGHTWQNIQPDILEYTMQLKATNTFGCSHETGKTIRVFPHVTAAFETSDQQYADCSPFAARFANHSSLADTYFWDFGDGNTSISTQPLHAFVNTEPHVVTFPVILEATSQFGCTDTTLKEISVYPSPEAKFSATPDQQPYPNATISLTNHTNPGDWVFDWDFGDGNTSQAQVATFQHTYVWDGADYATKTYDIILKASNPHCHDIFSRQVTITSPVPKAQMAAALQGCEPFEIDFSNLSMYAHEYRWYFGDGGISFEAEPVYTYYTAGLYEMMLVAIGDGGKDTLKTLVEVFENPRADFRLLKNPIHIPREPIQVENRSERGAYYHWDFGDGNSSWEFEPYYYFQEAGVYDITLTVYTDTEPQCAHTKVLQSGLRVDEACQVLLPNAFKPSAAGSSGGAYHPGNPTNEVFHPLYEGIDSYELEIYTRWGELIFRSGDPAMGWDGYVRGNLAPAGVYVWKVKARCTTGEVIDKAGDVTLIR